ncbi:MAG TPA: hypothetical protein VGD74_01105, partial [Vulgatibacter sp.]
MDAVAQAPAGFDWPGDDGLPAAGDGPGHRLELPLDGPPGAGARLEVELTVAADRLGEGEPGVLATARIEVEEPDLAVALVLTELDPGFDYDGDGVVDREDCEPDEPSIRPGAEDLCDGDDRDCVPGLCVLPLPGGYSGISDVECDEEGCVVGAVGQQAQQGSGALLFYAPALDDGPRATIAGVDPMGIAIVPGADRVYATTKGGVIKQTSRDGSTSEAAITILANLSRHIATSRYWDYANAAYASGPIIVSFKSSAAPEVPLQCIDDEPICSLSSLADLSDQTSSLGSSPKPAAMVMRHKEPREYAQTYVSFDRSERVAVATFDEAAEILLPISGLFSPLPTTPPRALALSPDSTRLYVAGGTV